MTISDDKRRLPLHAIAHGRAGDKGNVSNISIIAYLPEAYDFIREHLSEAYVETLFAHLGAGKVKRYDLPNLQAFNFVIQDALDGGVNASRSLDRHGKTLSYILLSRAIFDTPLSLVPKASAYHDPDFDWQG